jgi:hypothetical protein
MKFKTLLLFIIFTCLIHAQTKVLKITKTDNSISSFEVNLLKKVMFNDSTMIVNLKNGSVNKISISTIRSFTFSNLTKVNDIHVNSVSIYPNPATKVIQLQNLNSQIQLANIYSVTGQLLIKKQVSSADNNIEVSTLSKGVHLLTLNGQTIKFVIK